MKLDNDRLTTVTEPDFWKKIPDGSAGLKKVPKIVQKSYSWGFDKNLIHLCVLFVLEYESANGLLTFCQEPHVWEIYSSLVIV